MAVSRLAAAFLCLSTAIHALPTLKRPIEISQPDALPKITYRAPLAARSPDDSLNWVQISPDQHLVADPRGFLDISRIVAPNTYYGIEIASDRAVRGVVVGSIDLAGNFRGVLQEGRTDSVHVTLKVDPQGSQSLVYHLELDGGPANVWYREFAAPAGGPDPGLGLASPQRPPAPPNSPTAGGGWAPNSPAGSSTGGR